MMCTGKTNMQNMANKKMLQCVINHDDRKCINIYKICKSKWNMQNMRSPGDFADAGPSCGKLADCRVMVP